MEIPDWTHFRSAETDPAGACCLLPKAFPTERLPANYIWTLGYIGVWPDHPEAAEISAQVKSYSREWLREREKHLSNKRRHVEQQERQYRALADKARREQEERTRKARESMDPEVVKQRIEAGPAAMARSLLKTAGDLASGGITDPKERLSICNTCPFKGDDGRCGKCGCVLAAKTRVKKASCPIGRW